MSSKLNVLVLCTHNAARSQMAEALIRLRASDRFNAYSAGIEPGRVHPLAIRAMEEIGVDMSAHRSKGIDEFLCRLRVDYLIAVCSGAAKRCPAVWPGVEHRLIWPFDDPSAVEGGEEVQLDAFRRTRDAIDRKIQQWLTTLDAEGRPLPTPQVQA